MPKRVVFVGAGYIAAELAGTLHGLGAETHSSVMNDHYEALMTCFLKSRRTLSRNGHANSSECNTS